MWLNLLKIVAGIDWEWIKKVSLPSAHFKIDYYMPLFIYSSTGKSYLSNQVSRLLIMTEVGWKKQTKDIRIVSLVTRTC